MVKRILQSSQDDNEIAGLLARHDIESSLDISKSKTIIKLIFEFKSTHGFKSTSEILTNRAVEVTEMWRVYQKEKPLDDRKRNRSNRDSQKNNNRCGAYERNHSYLCSSRTNAIENGLRDNEVEEFLHSRPVVVPDSGERLIGQAIDLVVFGLVG
ncbi:hypothetical protein Tco_0129579 [Tanacetum coccineum]